MTAQGDSLGDRQNRLQDEVEKLVLAGWRIRLQREGRVVLARTSFPPFWLNLILTIITAGLWLVVLLVWWLSPTEERCVVWLDADGRVLQTPA